MQRFIDLTGKKFGKLTVIEKAPTRISKAGHYVPYWYCVCDCQLNLPEEEREIITVQARKLREGKTTSCGCYKREWHKKTNDYVIEGNTVRMFDNNKHEFLIDLDDLDIVTNYLWKVSNRGYVLSYTPSVNGKRSYISLHRLVMKCSDSNVYIDHINHNTSDNRKCNLRTVTPTQNQHNVRPSSRNKSGIRGVRFNKSINKWEVGFSINGKHSIVGYYKNIADAIACRKQYEEKYYGEYAYKGD